jgi:hypothetical protein
MGMQEANLGRLTKRYFDQTPAREGAVIVDKFGDATLNVTLASHWLRSPNQENVRRRDAIDYLLAYYSILEVAAIAGCIEPQPPQLFTDPARRRLERPAMARYYSRYYPLLLPQLFVRRLNASPLLIQHDAFPEFVRFLHVSELRRGDDIDMFLWFLDDGVEDEYGLTDVLGVFAEPAQLAKVLTRSQDRRNARDQAVRGLLLFLKFCREFDALLQSCTAQPLLQSAFWHFHGYWFQQLGVQLTGVIGAVIESYRDQVGTEDDVPAEAPPEKQQLIAATHADMDHAHRSMQRLVSGLYSAPLDAAWLSDAASETNRSA